MASATGQLLRELHNHARTAGLRIDCCCSGSVNAKIAFVGDYVGETEVRTGMPLSGGAGKVLWDALKKIDLSRNQVYTTNVIKRQVSMSNKSNVKSPIDKTELLTWRELLKFELAQLPNLELVVLMGNFALEAVLGEKGISNWRGSLVSRQLGERNMRVYVLNNPAAVIHDPRSEVVFRMDVGKLGRIVAGKFEEHVINATINPTFDEACDIIHNYHYECSIHGTPLSYDIETIAGETACIGFATDANHGACIALRGMQENTYTLEQDIRLYRDLQQLLCSPKVRLIAQNGAYDATWLWFKDRIRVAPHYIDTLLGHHCLYPRLPHSLQFLTTQYTNHRFYKDEKDTWRTKDDIDQFWEYNVKDACITWACAKRIEQELKQQKLWDFFQNHVMRVQRHLIPMTVLGLPINVQLRDELYHSYTDDVVELEREVHDAIAAATGIPGYPYNPNSPDQEKRLLFHQLKLRGRNGKATKENREAILENEKTPEVGRRVVRAIQEYKTAFKFLSTYARIPLDYDNRIRCDWKQYGVVEAPGRLSSASTGWHTGANLQNQPDKARCMFIAPPGYTLVYFDLAQAEARFVAWDAKIDLWIEQFERARLDGSYDAHRALASELFDVPYEQVPAYDVDENGEFTIRYVAKRCRHGLNYRMQAPRLAITAKLPMGVAYRAYHLYHSNTPELRPWWDRLSEEVHKTKRLFNAYGRRLIFLEPLTDQALEAIVAFRPQSTIGDKVTRIIYLCESDPEWPMGCRVALNIHDALIALAPHSKAKRCARIMKKHAEEPINVRDDMPPLIIPADVKLSVPCDAEINSETGQVEFDPNPNGFHCWGYMKGVEL